MPADKEARPLASPWKEFLTELDGMLDEPLELHCIGGFVFTYFYGLPRTTGDIDYYTAIPVNLNLDEVAGQGSPLPHETRSLASPCGRCKPPGRLRNQADGHGSWRV
jgi:hypothetical protein